MTKQIEPHEPRQRSVLLCTTHSPARASYIGWPDMDDDPDDPDPDVQEWDRQAREGHGLVLTVEGF